MSLPSSSAQSPASAPPPPPASSSSSSVATPSTPAAVSGVPTSSSTSSSTQSSANAAPIQPPFVSHIAGVPTDFGQPVHVSVKKPLQRQINSIIGWHELDRSPLTLPQPFVRSNEPQVGEHPYFVSERSVGVRYLVVLVQGRCYLVSQNYDVREAILFAPVRPDRLQPGTDRNAIVPHQWTILDGLLVCDKENNKATLTMIVNDILALNGTPVMSSKLQDRLKLIQNDVIAPRKQILPPKGQPADQFQLVQQYMYPLNRVSHVIRNLIPRIAQTRQNAGLMFTPVMLPYTSGPAKGFYTWTPTTQLTVDFQLGVEWRGRPPMPGFKLMLHDKRMQHFHDWLTFAPDEFEFFRTDKRAPSRIIECVYDPEWLTFVPSHDKTSWDVGSAEFQGTERGPGWRQGGWRFVRCRGDRSMPIERSLLSTIEKAISEDVRMEEIEALFPEDPSKKHTTTLPKQHQQQQPRSDASGASAGSNNLDDFSSGKKKRGVGPGTGVCYDFQNKGVCQRGRFCHFSHCACNSTCSCTSAKNTYGQRPAYRRPDFDAPPSPSMEPSADGGSSMMPPDKPLSRPIESYDRDHNTTSGSKGGDHVDEEEAGELIDSVNLNVASVYAPLENFDKETLAAKRAQLTALGNRRIWASLGLEDKPSRKRTCGLIVSKTGEISIVRASDK